MIVALGLGHLVEFEFVVFFSVSLLFSFLYSLLFSHTPYPFPDFVIILLLFPSFFPLILFLFSYSSALVLVWLFFFLTLSNTHFFLS